MSTKLCVRATKNLQWIGFRKTGNVLDLAACFSGFQIVSSTGKVTFCPDEILWVSQILAARRGVPSLRQDSGI